MTRGLRDENKSPGNCGGVNSRPAIGEEPEEPSATSFVYSCASFLAPVSTRRAWGNI